MACAAKRLLVRSAGPLGCALVATWPTTALASDLRLFTPDTLEINGDLRFGRCRRRAQLGRRRARQASFGQQRRPSRSSAARQRESHLAAAFHLVTLRYRGRLAPGRRADRGGLSQAYLTFKPMRGSKVAFSARAGLMWPPVSLEHEGADWHVNDSITPRRSTAGSARK